MVAPVILDAFEQCGMGRKEIGFTVSGSTDFLSGLPFSFAHALDAAAPWPPIPESHVEMDGAWALYEAWVKLQIGEVDTALVYSFGKSSTPDDLVDVLALQMDPYSIVPLGVDSIGLAALQAQALLDKGRYTERNFAEIAVKNRRAAMNNPCAQLKGEFDVETLLGEPCIASPLRRHACPPITDGACAMIIASAEVAGKYCERPAWIRGFDHRIDAHQPGLRDLTVSPSTTLATEMAGVHRDKVDLVELCAPFAHQELILLEAMGLKDSATVNPSGGAMASNPIMSAGLIRVGEVAQRIWRGEADRGVAHATSGSCLQQNLVTVLEGS
jgi:acetyl-CoA acetyltransferase